MSYTVTTHQDAVLEPRNYVEVEVPVLNDDEVARLKSAIDKGTTIGTLKVKDAKQLSDKSVVTLADMIIRNQVHSTDVRYGVVEKAYKMRNSITQDNIKDGDPAESGVFKLPLDPTHAAKAIVLELRIAQGSEQRTDEKWGALCGPSHHIHAFDTQSVGGITAMPGNRGGEYSVTPIRIEQRKSGTVFIVPADKSYHRATLSKQTGIAESVMGREQDTAGKHSITIPEAEIDKFLGLAAPEIAKDAKPETRRIR